VNFVSLPLTVVIVNIAIVYTLLEAVFFMLVYFRSGRCLHPKDYLLNLISGLCLMLALRAALASAWPLVPIFLMLSGAAHGYDILIRLRGKNPPRTDQRAKVTVAQPEPR
jgi:hypothetical protein